MQVTLALSSTAFQAVHEALQQYLDNQPDEYLDPQDESLRSPEHVARLAAVQALVDQLDAAQASLAE